MLVLAASQHTLLILDHLVYLFIMSRPTFLLTTAIELIRTAYISGCQHLATARRLLILPLINITVD